jgi:hypothetical protein
MTTDGSMHLHNETFCASTTVIAFDRLMNVCPGHEANLPTRFCLESLCPLLDDYR